MGWRNAAGTSVTAVAERMTAKSACFTSDGGQSFGSSFVARIHNEIEGAVESHGAQITGVQGDQGASRITGAAVDTLWLMTQRPPFRAVMRNAHEIIRIEIVTRDEMREGKLIGLKEGFQINGEVTGYRQVAQRLDAQFRADGADQGGASEAFASIHDHGARPAHADATGESKCQIRARPALQREERVEHAGFGGDLDGMRFEAGGPAFRRGAALHADGNFKHGFIMRGGALSGNGFGMRCESIR